MATYSIADLIGKTMIAKGSVSLFRLPYDNAPAIYDVKPGNTIGIVDSYVLPKEGRTAVYLMFYDKDRRAYYMRWGAPINTTSLIEQGVKSDVQKAEEAKGDSTIMDFIQKNISLVVVTVALVAIAKTGIQTYGGHK